VTGRRTRVLFVGAFPEPTSPIVGGMVTSCRILLASSLPRRLELELFDSTQISNPPPRFAVRLARAAARCLRFARRFEKNPPQVVWLFVADGASVVEKGAMAWYARLRGVPAIMFPRAGSVVDAARRSLFSRTAIRWCFRGAARIVCQSDAWRAFAVQTLGFEAHEVAVIRNWTATADLLRIGAERSTADPAAVRLVFVGWLERDKGVFDLIEACRTLAATRRFTLDLVGDGRAAEQARELVARYDLRAQVRFRGWLQQTQLHQILSESQVLVLPSWAEGLPNAMIEAMAARLAIVASTVGAIPEVIIDRQDGLLVAPRDPAALARALGEVIDNPHLRAALAAEAFRIANAEFGVERAVERLVAEVEELVERGAR
jgi:glycosyltransferase involved in cell wall biosynthesis